MEQCKFDKDLSTDKCNTIWASTRENLSLGSANNEGADQPAHPHSLISAFAIRLLESIIAKLATSNISLFYLVSIADQAGLGTTWFKTLKTSFLF